MADPAVRRKATLVLVDDLAGGLAATAHPEVSAFAHRTGHRTGGEATVLAGGRGSRERAAAANAVAIGWDELDGGYRPAPCHGGLYAVPAALAEAEATGARVDDLLSALVVGYELAAAVAEAFPPAPALELHPHAALAPVGAAAAVTWLRTRSSAAVLAAGDAAITLGARGPFQHATRGLLVRNVWAGAGAQQGFLAADAAGAGLGADAGALLDVLAPRTPFVDALPDTDWAVLAAYHKTYAACQYAHAAIEAALALAATVRPEDVREVAVETHPLALALEGTAPQTVLAGKFSVPHAVAAVLVAGRADPDVFGAELLHHPAVAALRTATSLGPLQPLPAPPHDRAARVTVHLVGGGVRTETCLSAKGSPDRPLSEADVLDKAGRLTTGVAPGFVGEATRTLSGVRGDVTAGDWLRSLIAPA
ncbi:MmgE/PrpD family protein [Nocardioides anomalus]|uniref:MmgE/PrpD family protein n=1 Tax=Nocardioides anomalus TaxID=2712223 RepID=A0A6G6WDA5_9ACTN|nr:MmgE/PrpD family protein [Nocardioides anomalus]QIG43186.1 MmgE/PrpD family protein [Nocardioides anomalus]